MAYDDELREGRELSQVGYQQFMLLTRIGRNGLFCFFEGKDAPYYIPRIKSCFGGEYYPIICGDKKKL